MSFDEMVAEAKLEEAHSLLAAVMEDIGHLLPWRGVVDWWLQTNAPDPLEHQFSLPAVEPHP